MSEEENKQINQEQESQLIVEDKVQLPSAMQPGEEGFFVIYNKNINIPCKVTRVGFLTHKVLYDIALLIQSEGKNDYIIYIDNVDSIFVQKQPINE